MDDADRPALRASDADRERAADLLREAAGDGRLTVDELDERLTVAYATVTRDELDRLLADLGTTTDAVPTTSASTSPAARGGRLPVRPGPGGSSWIVSVMGANDRKGHWRVAARCVVVNVMGSSDLDFNDAELASGEVVVRVFSLMGGSSIRVPDGLTVDVSKFSLMGGNDVDLGSERPDPGGPRLRLQLFSLMGGNEVKRGRRRSREQRRLDREERRERHELRHADRRDRRDR